MPVQTITPPDTRRTVTPNATMTTLASPSLGATAGLSLWVVEMTAGSRGPRHVVDSEQLWTLVSGELALEGDGDTVTLRAGDTAVLPAGVARQISARAASRALVCGHGDAVVRVVGEAGDRGTPAWIA